jgi:hypothetical protein
VIGIVKDPAAIEWLYIKLRSGKMDRVYESFLYDWEPRPGEMGAWRWLPNPGPNPLGRAETFRALFVVPKLVLTTHASNST